MKLDDLTSENIEKIFEIYARNCIKEGADPLAVITWDKEYGGDRSKPIIEDIKTGQASYRVGVNSKIKLYVNRQTGNVDIMFNPNFAPEQRDSPKYFEALEAGKKFEEEVREYLNLKGEQNV